MLTALCIRDVVLIEALDIEFASGLSALTGETGAGKSILLDALGLALGARADAGLVRKGAQQASVQADFMVQAGHPIYAIFDEQGLVVDAPHVTLRRVVGVDGRSKAFINDQPVGVGVLKRVGDVLVDIHSQFETHGLMDAATHIHTLDGYAGVDSQQLRGLWDSWRDLQAQRTALFDKIEQARRDADYWQSAYEDLVALDVQEGEEEALLERRAALAARSQLAEAFGEADALIDGEGGAMQSLNRAWRVLERVLPKAGDKLNDVLQTLDGAMADIRGSVDTLQSWFDGDDGFDSLEAVDERLHALRAQARKHQCHVSDLPALLEDISARLAAIRGDDGALAALDKAVAQAKAAFEAQAKIVSDKRVTAAAALDNAVMAELPPLKLDKARFETVVDVLPVEAWGPLGMNRVQFMVATNPGAAAGAIDKVASGGELSRFMLAIKVVLSATSPVPVMVFDEVDSGLGGATADAVGERLARLAGDKQILVVTHSPQVAAKAGYHFVVSKAANDDAQGAIRTSLIPISGMDARAQEIARMISGAQITPEALAAAGKLLQHGT